ncbi:ribokinase [Enterococcus hulanensis]|uniref:ribokinase n=1 Tax=Enterococcus hulanensis TaxID=2559929 RepID=UPI001A90B651|nr:ribokinase [Enterococcus hulanensis]MBO0457724.1 ribokinase [Enterococcus hulanensis]
MIVEVGSLNVDFIVHNRRFPKPGETVIGKSVTVMAGGKGANQIAAAARLGAETRFLSKVGELDQYNSMLMSDLAWAGVPTNTIGTVSDLYTGSAYCMICEDSQNCIVIIEGANEGVTADFVESNRDLLSKSSIVMCEFSINQEACDYAMKLGKELGVTTLCNPAPFRKVDDSFYKNVDIVTPNEVEAAEACGFEITDEESAARGCEFFHQLGVEKVIITMGKLGAFCSDGSKQEMIESCEVNACDSSGAGDCFNGAFAYAFDKGYDFFEAARFANAAAAASVQKLGTMRSMPCLEEVEAIYGKEMQRS